MRNHSKPDDSEISINRGPVVIFGALVFLSGMAALGHQLLWARRLIDLLGASGESSARVFGTFFLGLSIGSAIAAMLVGRTRHPLKLAGCVQLSIPVLVIPVVFLSELTDWIWPAIGTGATLGANGSLIRSLLTLAFVLPPTVMMGLSFPLIVAGVLRINHGRLGRTGINLYAINTLGGASGILFTVMVAVPRFGNFASMVLAGAVDAAVGIALLAIARRQDARNTHSSEQPDVTENESPSANPFTDAIGLAFFSGMAVLALEVVAFQMFQLVATISLFSPAAVLFCAIASLGTSAALFSRFRAVFDSISKKHAIVTVLCASGVLVVISPQVFMGIAQNSNWFASNGGVVSFVLKLAALTLLSVGPAWLVAGFLFPLAVARAGEHCSSTQSGQRLGLLLAVNGLGGLLGAEFSYRVLLPGFGVYGAMTAIALGFAATAVVYSLLSDRAAHWRTSGLSAVTAVGSIFVLGQFNSHLPVVNPPPGIEPIDLRFGREGTVAVMEDGSGSRTILVSNQYVLGGTAVRYNQERQVLLPLVLHENPQRVGCIGLATGITPGAALSVDSVEQVTAIELSPLVAEVAAEYFDDFNHHICDSESAAVVIGDGRTVIASIADGFDVITGDLFLPWAPGTARLYSREHFACVRRALKEDGVFCQWLPMYQLTPDQFRLIANTFANEFGETHLFMNHFHVTSPMLGLVGRKKSRGLDWNQIARRCDRLRESNSIRDPVLRHESGLRMLYLGRWQGQKSESRTVSLADPSLEYSAATVRLSADPGKKYYNPTNWIRFCRSRQRLLADNSLPESPAAGDLMNLATGLLELDYARRTRHRLADSIAIRASQAIPSGIREDDSADRERWPGPQLMWPYNQSRDR